MEVIEKDGKEYIAISPNGLRNAMYYVKDKPELKGLLDALLESKDSECEPKDVTERIKTFEDAYNELGINHKFVVEYNDCKDSVSKDLKAYLKLRIVCAALNEEWEPTFAGDEYRYYPYFVLYTEEEVERMDDKTKNKLGLFGGDASDGARCGFVAASASNAFGSARADFGSRLCFRTRELAVYCGKQFIDLWKDYYIETAK